MILFKNMVITLVFLIIAVPAMEVDNVQFYRRMLKRGGGFGEDAKYSYYYSAGNRPEPQYSTNPNVNGFTN